MNFIGLDLMGLEFIHTYLQNPIMDDVMIAISKLGSGGIIWFVIGFGLVMTKKYRRIGWMALLSLVLAIILAEGILKKLVQRPRPFIEITYLKLLIDRPESFSFPSGHTSMAFATVISLIGNLKKPWLIGGLIVFAVIMSFSRLYLLVHYPSDIVGGIIVGLMSAILAKYILDLKKERSDSSLSKSI